MGQSARVTSVEALQDFRHAVISFCESVQAGLCANQMESRRVLDWLVFERPAFWKRKIEELQEEVSQAQTELHRIKMMKAQGYNVDDIQPKRMLEKAKQELAEAQEKQEQVSRWTRIAQRAVEEYEARARRLADLVEGDPPPVVIFLDRAVDSLDAYLRVEIPAGSVRESVSSSVVAVPSTGAATDVATDSEKK